MSLGAEALVREWRADMAIVTEPTDLRLAIGHKGFAWIDVTTRGIAAHGSRPDDGRDAIARMGRVLVSLESHDRALRARPPVPFQGTGSLHASIIRGGQELSSYPDLCALQMERRTVSGEDEATIAGEMASLIALLKRDDSEFDASATVTAYRPAYHLDAAHALPSAMGHALRRAALDPEPTGMSFWTDAAILGDAGIPSILYGPTGAGLHSVEEWVETASVLKCRDALVALARDWCR